MIMMYGSDMCVQSWHRGGLDAFGVGSRTVRPCVSGASNEAESGVVTLSALGSVNRDASGALSIVVAQAVAKLNASVPAIRIF